MVGVRSFSGSPGCELNVRSGCVGGAPLVGVGVETVGIDAGAADDFDPPFPLHYYLLGGGSTASRNSRTSGRCRRPARC
ncbi:hypothetical protein BH24ACT19_BH24ACT19_02630 [soil metagenome]